MWILPKNYPLSSRFARDMVASKEDLSLLDSIIDSSLFVRSKPMSKSSLLRKWKRDTWFQRLCGQILKPSQHRSFETKLMSYLQVIPANRLAKLGNGGGKMIHDTCGPTSRNTSEQLDLFGVSSRTCKDTSRWDSPQSSQIWKNWVIEQRGEYSQRKKLALRIKEKECLSWGTPRHSKYKGCGPIGSKSYQHWAKKKYLTAQVINFQPDQNKSNMNGKNQELSNWPTPAARDHKGTNSPEKTIARIDAGLRANMGQLPNAVMVNEIKNWPTPTAAEANKIGNNANYGQKGLSNHPSIVGQVTREKGIKSGKENWATPQARDWKGAEGRAYKGLTKDLPAQTELREKSTKSGKEKNWPTPRHQDVKHAKPTDWEMTTDHAGTVNSLRVKAAKEKHGGKLNPDWCEQLMGLPVGWTKIDDADDRISRLMAIGNGVVPQTAALAWVTLSEKIKQ